MAFAVKWIPNPHFDEHLVHADSTRAVIVDLAENVEGKYRAGVPRESGALAASIGTQLVDTRKRGWVARVGAGVRYAAVVEYGSSKRGREPDGSLRRAVEGAGLKMKHGRLSSGRPTRR